MALWTSSDSLVSSESPSAIFWRKQRISVLRLANLTFCCLIQDNTRLSIRTTKKIWPHLLSLFTMALPVDLFVELDDALDFAGDRLAPDRMRHFALHWATKRLEYLGILLDGYSIWHLCSRIRFQEAKQARVNFQGNSTMSAVGDWRGLEAFLAGDFGVGMPPPALVDSPNILPVVTNLHLLHQLPPSTLSVMVLFADVPTHLWDELHRVLDHVEDQSLPANTSHDALAYVIRALAFLGNPTNEGINSGECFQARRPLPMLTGEDNACSIISGRALDNDTPGVWKHAHRGTMRLPWALISQGISVLSPSDELILAHP
ncbi:hypothetical protein BC567DRAFT_212446 [Phyllosticta citribraziliensis]